MSQATAAGDDRGFTILELLIVIAIAGVVSATAVFRIPDLSDRMALDRLGSDIERQVLHAGWRARESGTDQVIRFDSGTRQLMLPAGRSLIFDDATSASWLGAAESPANESDGTLTIFGGGGASGGELLIARGKYKVRIRIDWLSARTSRTSA